jgi:hypothetical protein
VVEQLTHGDVVTVAEEPGQVPGDRVVEGEDAAIRQRKGEDSDECLRHAPDAEPVVRRRRAPRELVDVVPVAEADENARHALLDELVCRRRERWRSVVAPRRHDDDRPQGDGHHESQDEYASHRAPNVGDAPAARQAQLGVGTTSPTSASRATSAA